MNFEPLNPIARALIEAIFPARCLVCGSFYRTNALPSGNLKGLLNCLMKLDPEHPVVSNRENGVSPLHKNKNRDHLLKIFRMLMAPFLCDPCSRTFMPVQSPICSMCGLVFKSRQGEDRICGDCIESPKKYGMARSAGIYDQALMGAIHCLKYKEKIQLSRPLGLLLFIVFCRYWSKKPLDVILPVPLHKKKLRARGFNPPYLLVRHWASIFERLNSPVSQAPVAMDILFRKKYTAPQTGLGRKERLKNIKNAFVVKDTSKIAKKKILLVDDVYTTGATANECVKVLLKGGAKQVDVITLARAI